MSTGPQIPDDNALAGEYVLGVLPLSERRAVEERLLRDSEFASLVASWQADLSSLDEAYEPQTPPKGVKARVDARLFAEAAKPAGGLWGSLVFWRGLAFASVAAAAAFGIYSSNLIEQQVPGSTPALVAELGAPGSSVGLIAALDPRTVPLPSRPRRFRPMTASRWNYGWCRARVHRFHLAWFRRMVAVWFLIRRLFSRFLMARFWRSVSSRWAVRPPAWPQVRWCCQARSPENNVRLETK